MVRFVQNRQVEGSDVGHHRLEFAVLARADIQPFGKNRTDSAGARAADNDVETMLQDRLLWYLSIQ